MCHLDSAEEASSSLRNLASAIGLPGPERLGKGGEGEVGGNEGEEEGGRGSAEREGDPLVEVHLVGGYNDIARQSTASGDHTNDRGSSLEGALGTPIPNAGSEGVQRETCAHGRATDNAPQEASLGSLAQSQSLLLIHSTLQALHSLPHVFSLKSLCLWDANTVYHHKGHPLPWCRAFWVCPRHTLSSLYRGSLHLRVYCWFSRAYPEQQIVPTGLYASAARCVVHCTGTLRILSGTFSVFQCAELGISVDNDKSCDIAPCP